MSSELREQRGRPSRASCPAVADRTCAACGRAPGEQWQCHYERWARLAWRLITGPLTPAWGRGYYVVHLEARIGPVVEHIAHGVAPVRDQLVFVEACTRMPMDQQTWDLRARDLDALDPTTASGRRAIRTAFAEVLEHRLVDTLHNQPAEDKPLGLPREIERYPWPPKPGRPTGARHSGGEAMAEGRGIGGDAT